MGWGDGAGGAVYPSLCRERTAPAPPRAANSEEDLLLHEARRLDGIAWELMASPDAAVSFGNYRFTLDSEGHPTGLVTQVRERRLLR